MTQKICDISKNNTQESLILSPADVITHEGWSKDYLDNFAKWHGKPLERPE